MSKENNGFMACPFCGRTDKVVVMTEDFFYELQGRHDTAALTVTCKRCEAVMWEHTYGKEIRKARGYFAPEVEQEGGDAARNGRR